MQFIRTTSPFTIYKDNYIITGTKAGVLPETSNSDLKQQISFKHRLTKPTLPFDTYLFITYTQKSFWDIYKWSSPFKEINFNPGLGVGKLLYRKNRLVGSLALQVEHESNGLGGSSEKGSRGWNYISANYTMLASPGSVLQLKAWLPFQYTKDNPDLIDYVGYGQVAYNWEIKRNKLVVDLVGRKGAEWSWKGNIRTQLSYNPFKTGSTFITLQWYQGYAESLINYRQPTSMLRLGMAIRPSNFLLYFY
ncbi:hypothetical protein GCM10027443_12470 [Pontibacter brevis]